MGRKPHKLILEFFERGQKLEDASNRYQHTCKACGEKFPKGRIDSLTNHLVKCPAIPLSDRRRAVLLLHDVPDVEGADGGREPSSYRIEKGGKTRAIPSRGSKTDLPTLGSRPWTPLDALAEVSRQVGESEKKDPSDDPDETPTERAVNGDRQDAKNQLKNGKLKTPKTEPVQSSEQEPPIDTALPPIFTFDALANSPVGSPHLPSLSLPLNGDVESSRVRSALSLTAQSANDLQAVLPKPGVPMEPVLELTENASISDKYFFSSQPLPARSTMTWPLQQQGAAAEGIYLDITQDQIPTVEMTPARASTFPRPIAANPNTPQRELSAEFGNGAKSSRPKVRGRFSAVRRKEVQEVRKRGACIRCRMLKKPCSGESPCSTCRNVESARLWKQPCIRTRIADELQLYSAGLHSVLAHHDITHIKSTLTFQRSMSQIEASHYSEDPIAEWATFKALEGHRSVDQNISDFLNVDDQLQDIQTHAWMLDHESDDIPGKLEQYLKLMAPTFYERELSPFMRTTLAVASSLAAEKEDVQLSRVLDLWAVNHVLVDIEMRWRTFEKTEDGERNSIDEETDEQSYQLICSQLRAAAEKRASHLSKGVMNDLERRLLQRTQGGWFETYLVAILLLNCVERGSWLFRTWAPEQFRSKWPLDRPPSYYYEQGEHFADMLQMLLKMRNLPPKVHDRDDDGIIREYFKSIHLSSKQLEDRHTAGFDALDSRCLELKFCSKLLQPP